MQVIGIADALIQWVILGEIREIAPPGIGNRNGQQFGKFDRRRVACRITTYGFGDDGRVRAGDKHVGHALDFGGGRYGQRRFRNGPRVLRRGPVMQHGLDRHRHIDRAGGRTLRHFTGADELFVQCERATDSLRPLGDRLHQVCRAADNG